MRILLMAIMLNTSFGFTQNNDTISTIIKNKNSEATSFKISTYLDSLWQKEFLIYPKQDTTFTKENSKTLFINAISTDTLKKRLAFLNTKSPLVVEYSPMLERTINAYLKYRKTDFEHLLELSNYYFPLFEEVFDREQIPLEIKYLAVVESMLKHNAISPVGASGLWQFMFSTAKHYNLEVSSYVDERCDPIRATIAAAKYLKKLYSIFGDWNLAMAAYNSGPGNVTKAMRKSGGHSNYWNIRPFLPEETAAYIPKFLATMYLFEFAEEHGLRAQKQKFHFTTTDTVSVHNMISLDHVQMFLGVDKKILEFLNPSYKLGIIPVIKNRQYKLRLPVDLIGLYVTLEKNIYEFANQDFDQRENPLPKFFKMDDRIRYTIKSGDYLGKIANKFNVGISEIRRWNNLTSDKLRAGERITIFTRNLNSEETISTSPVGSSQKTYIVQKGDSLWSISKKFSDVSVENLKKWNGISGNNLQPGMQLVISK